jgi:hypothetical protein
VCRDHHLEVEAGEGVERFNHGEHHVQIRTFTNVAGGAEINGVGRVGISRNGLTRDGGTRGV